MYVSQLINSPAATINDKLQLYQNLNGESLESEDLYFLEASFLSGKDCFFLGPVFF